MNLQFCTEATAFVLPPSNSQKLPFLIIRLSGGFSSLLCLVSFTGKRRAENIFKSNVVIVHNWQPFKNMQRGISTHIYSLLVSKIRTKQLQLMLILDLDHAW